MERESNFLTDNASIRTIDSRRIIYFVLAVVFFFLTEIGRKIYRPFIYSNHIDDYGIADSIGNSGGIIVQIFFTLTIFNSPGKKAFYLIGFLVVGYILYEIVQPYLPRGVFDWKDIYGSFIGGAVALLMLFFTKRLTKNKVIYKF